MSTEKVLSLKDFIRRAQSLKLFRDFLRQIRRVPNQQLQSQIRVEVKTQFRYNSHLVDSMAYKSAMIEAHRSLKQIEALSVKGSENEIGDAVVDNHDSTDESSSSDGNYRVGTGWPWDR